MRVFLMALVTAASGLVGADDPPQPVIRGDGMAQQATFAQKNFDALRVSGPFHITVKRGPRFGVEVSGDRNLVPLVQVQVDGTTLVVEIQGQIEPKLNLELEVVLPALVRYDQIGCMQSHVDEFEVKCLTLTATGNGMLVCSARAREVTIEARGGAAIDLRAGRVEHATISGTGGTTIQLPAIRSVRGRLIGRSKLTYQGEDARVNVSMIGASTVERSSRETGRP